MNDCSVKIWNDRREDNNAPVVVLALEDERAVLTPDQAEAVATALLQSATMALTGSVEAN